MKKHLLFLFAALLPLVASAQTKVEIDGIWYNLTAETREARVTSASGTDYSGSITIPTTVTYDGVAYSVTRIGYSAFSNCCSLTAITIPESVTSIESHAFYNCTSLTAISIPENSQLTSIAYFAFNNCDSLTAINIPESVTSIGERAFASCSSLTAINIPESVTSISERAFEDCSSLTAIIVAEGNIMYDSRNNCNAIIKTANNTLHIGCATTIIPEGVTSIGNFAFYKCNSLTSITIPKGVTSLEDFAFQYCTNLTSITLPEGLTTIDLAAISHCDSLKTITIPASVTKLGDYAFDYTGFTDVLIPENSQLESIGDYAFSYCNNLNSITIPSSVPRIGDRTFEGCSSLTTINIPEGVTSIGDCAFYNCSSLTTINIPEGVTSIGDFAFYNCSSLTTIVLPKNLTEIGSRAFTKCTGLLDVYCYAETVPSTKADAFTSSNIEHATLHVPAGLIADYKATAPWSSFGKVETLEITVDEITLSQSAAELIEGESLQLTATVSPDDAEDKSISWSSNNPSVATVDNAGKVTAIAPGTATITVTANDGSGVSAQCEVTVTPASYVITFLIDGEQFFVETLTRGSAITLPEVPAKEGYTFSGWGEVPETMPAKDVTISGTFTANKYLVTFKIDDEVIIADSLEYGTAIVAPEAPEKEGYTFSGWGEVAGNVPAYDLTYEGSYSINSYTLTYMVDGEVVLTLPMVYGATTPSLKVPAKEGYKFSGWSEAPAVMPAKDVTIEGTFTQLPSIYLTINQADNGYVKQHLVVGTVCAYTIEAAEGWKIHSVTFNGEDVTSQLTEEGTFTTAELQYDATLNIAYEKIDDGIAAATASRIKVQGHQGVISIAGATEGEAIGLYTTSGTLVATATAEGESTQLTVPTGQVYIVKVADAVVKIGM